MYLVLRSATCLTKHGHHKLITRKMHILTQLSSCDQPEDDHV